MSRIDKWLYFFEVPSKSRSTESWWGHIESEVLSYGLKVRGLVSDRARALIKLGKADYLDVVSSADLFHYCQDMGKAIGCKIGQQLGRIGTKLKDSSLKEPDRILLESERAVLLDCQASYRKEIETINKTVHPFDEENQLQSKGEIEKELTKGFIRICHLGREQGIEVKNGLATKILNQIPDIAKGVEGWQVWFTESVDRLIKKERPQNKEQIRNWITNYLMPFIYWQINFPKTQARAKNKNLREDYKNQVEKSRINYEQNDFTRSLNPEQKALYEKWAINMARKFQRSSSRVEGRNGYLAFVHHAHKGIPTRRLEVLTVVHNFDMLGVDGKSCAQRLFEKPFPSLFDFVLENVTAFAEPRTRKHKSLIFSSVQS